MNLGIRVVLMLAIVSSVQVHCASIAGKTTFEAIQKNMHDLVEENPALLDYSDQHALDSGLGKKINALLAASKMRVSDSSGLIYVDDGIIILRKLPGYTIRFPLSLLSTSKDLLIALLSMPWHRDHDQSDTVVIPEKWIYMVDTPEYKGPIIVQDNSVLTMPPVKVAGVARTVRDDSKAPLPKNNAEFMRDPLRFAYKRKIEKAAAQEARQEVERKLKEQAGMREHYQEDYEKILRHIPGHGLKGEAFVGTSAQADYAKRTQDLLEKPGVQKYIQEQALPSPIAKKIYVILSEPTVVEALGSLTSENEKYLAQQGVRVDNLNKIIYLDALPGYSLRFPGTASVEELVAAPWNRMRMKKNKDVESVEKWLYMIDLPFYKGPVLVQDNRRLVDARPARARYETEFPDDVLTPEQVLINKQMRVNSLLEHVFDDRVTLLPVSLSMFLKNVLLYSPNAAPRATKVAAAAAAVVEEKKVAAQSPEEFNEQQFVLYLKDGNQKGVASMLAQGFAPKQHHAELLDNMLKEIEEQQKALEAIERILTHA